ncbi:MAG: hypothetical protein Q7J98_08715 [Kiritimatiellia bacterium]|nr:hypothetical protein [Kiritimatiellia bacterium]
MHAANIRQQQAAKLQLLGRIAGGVAHDFSNILSAISGHAVLMQRFSDDKRSLNDSIGVIVNETQRGVWLSRQLLVLSRSSDFDGQASDNLAENVREVEELLRVALSAAWTVEAEIKGVFSTVPLSPAQVVQIVLNLGLLAADALKKPGKITIYLKQPDSLSQDFRRFAAIITISASADLPLPTEAGFAKAGSEDGRGRPPEADSGPAAVPQSTAMGMIDTTGIIPSVVRTLIEEAGGRLDELYASSIKSLYRICLPFAPKMGKSNWTPIRSIIKGPFRLKQWNILLASSDARFAWLEKMLADMGAVVEKKVAIDAVLGAIDSDRKPDVIIVDKALFGGEANGLLKAMRKICPSSGIIIISRRPEEEELRGERGFIFLEHNSGEETWLDAIFNSRQLVPRSA